MEKIIKSNKEKTKTIRYIKRKKMTFQPFDYKQPLNYTKKDYLILGWTIFLIFILFVVPIWIDIIQSILTMKNK